MNTSSQFVMSDCAEGMVSCQTGSASILLASFASEARQTNIVEGSVPDKTCNCHVRRAALHALAKPARCWRSQLQPSPQIRNQIRHLLLINHHFKRSRHQRHIRSFNLFHVLAQDRSVAIQSAQCNRSGVSFAKTPLRILPSLVVTT